MSQLTAVNTFTGGMNTDVNDLMLPSDSYKSAWNCVAGMPDKDGIGILENEKGNERISVTLPLGRNKCIGTCADESTDDIYYFIWNENGDHCIFRFNSKSKVVTRIVYPISPNATQILNFQENWYILNAKVVYISNNNQSLTSTQVEDNGKLLLWTDGYFVNDDLPFDIQTPSNSQLRKYNPPRSINIGMAINLTNNLLGARYPASFYTGNIYNKTQFYDAIKYPSVYAPSGVFGTDTTKYSNYFRNKGIPQFRIRYRYYDGEYSVWGGISDAVLPNQEEFIDNYQGGSIQINNYVDVQYQTGHESATEVELAVRFGNEGVWYRFDVEKKYDTNGNVVIPSNTFRTTRFYNDKVLFAISQEEALQPYDYLPITAGVQEFISTSDTNVFGYGDIREGRDLPTPSVEIEQVNRTANLNKWTLFGGTSGINIGAAPVWWSAPGSGLPYLFVQQNIPIQEYFIENTSLSLFTSSSGLANFIITKSDVDSVQTPLDVANWLISKISNSVIQFNNPVVSIQSGLLGWLIERQQPGVLALTWRVPVIKSSELKRGAEHNWGIIYEDEAGRMSTVVPIGQLYVKTIVEDFPNTLYQPDTYPCARPRFTINHQPPSWARKWRIAYGGNNIRRFIQISPVAGGLTTSRIEWDISNYEGYIDSIKPSSLQTVTPTIEGRLRLLVNDAGLTESNVVDLRVLESSTATSIHTPITDNTNYLNTGALVEYYEYQQSQNIIYNEFSQAYDVLFDGNDWYHAGNIQNQNTGQPSVVELPYGDVYVRQRLYYDSYPSGSVVWQSPIVDPNYSDFFDSDDISIGRINLEDPRYRLRILTNALRFSRNIIFNSGIVGINSFNENDLVELGANYGTITSMRMVGYVMKVLQEERLTSIYIRRRQIYSADGSPTLATTDATIGSVNVSDENYGCQNPESVAVEGRHLYYYDHNHGVLVRDAPNGQYPISQYGQVVFFRQRAIPQTTKAIGVFDKQALRYILTFVNENITMSFDENNNKFRSFHDYIPEMYGTEGISLVSFKDGELWMHNSDIVPRCSYYGVKYRQKITFIARPDPPLGNKIADSIEIHSNKVWEATDGAGGHNITTIPKTGYDLGMKSRLSASKFKQYENHFAAAFLFDANTPNMPSEEYALMNGRRLRDYLFQITLENNHDDYVTLLSVITKCTPSI